jgi:IS5 family transposase
MKKLIGVDRDSGLIHSVDTTSANVQDITRAAQQLQGNMEVAQEVLGFQGIKMLPQIAY